MSETPPPPPTGGDPSEPPQPQQQPQGWQPSWQPGIPTPAPAPAHAYDQSPQVPYGAPQYPPGYGPVLPDHPQANVVLVLGILGIVVCPVVAPVAWVMGNRVVREIDASGGAVGGRSNANVGRVLGLVITVLTIVVVTLGVLGVAVYVATGAA